MKTLFQKILDGEIPSKIVYQDDVCAAINDINPQAPVHVLLFPKKPIPRIAEATAEDARYVGERLREADRLEAEALGLRGVDAVMQSFYGSDECYTGLLDGEPMMLFGASGSLFRD